MSQAYSAASEELWTPGQMFQLVSSAANSLWKHSTAVNQHTVFPPMGDAVSVQLHTIQEKTEVASGMMRFTFHFLLFALVLRPDGLFFSSQINK